MSEVVLLSCNEIDVHVVAVFVVSPLVEAEGSPLTLFPVSFLFGVESVLKVTPRSTILSISLSTRESS